MELYSYITYCVSEHQCLVPGHLGSVGTIMRILTMTFIIFIARCTEQADCVGNAWYVRATEDLESSLRHGINSLRFLLFIFGASSQKYGSRSVQATTLTCTSFADHVDWPISLFYVV